MAALPSWCIVYLVRCFSQFATKIKTWSTNFQRHVAVYAVENIFLRRIAFTRKKWSQLNSQVKFLKMHESPGPGCIHNSELGQADYFPPFPNCKLFLEGIPNLRRLKKQQCLGKGLSWFNCSLLVFPPKLCRHLHARRAFFSSRNNRYQKIPGENRSHSHMSCPTC